MPPIESEVKMALSEEYMREVFSKKLVKIGEGYYVPISHAEIDSLIGRLMQICDIMGDTTQRQAVKMEIKHRTRDWLDDNYQSLGYDKFTLDREPQGIPANRVVEIPLEELPEIAGSTPQKG